MEPSRERDTKDLAPLWLHTPRLDKRKAVQVPGHGADWWLHQAEKELSKP